MFGGDKNKITIFGQSSGGWSVTALVRSPLSKGYFNRAIFDSGANFHGKKRGNKSPDEALKDTKQIAKHFNCSDDHKWLDCLRRIDAQEFALDPMIPIIYHDNGPHPVDNTEFLPLFAQQTFKWDNYSKGNYF